VDRYSDEPVTDAAIRTVVNHHPKFRAVCKLARVTKDEALGAFAKGVPAWRAARCSR
jgi:hypothetical protein